MKRLYSVITALVLLCSWTAVSAQDMTEAQKKDLYELKIMVGDENGELNLDNGITRAEMVKMLCVAGNVDAGSHSAEFPDVAKEHWAYDFVCAAKEYGIAEGDENGNFNPEAAVTNEEAVKMAVSLLGYDVMAETIGGYPMGYNTTASRLGITKDMQLVLGNAALRGDVGIMISNALDVPIMAKKDAAGDDEAYTVLDGKNGSELETLRIRMSK